MPPVSIDCSIGKYLSIRPAGAGDYDSLAGFHYRGPAPGPSSHWFALFDDHHRRRLLVPVAGIIVYRPPVPNLAIRNRVTGGFFAGLPRAAGLALLNEYARCISRVIIHPCYRGLGLASRLVRQTLPMTGAAMVEASGIMSCFNPFFRRAGMLEFRQPPDIKTERMKAALESVGIDECLWVDPRAVHERIDGLSLPQREFIERQMDDFLQKFARRRTMPPGIDRTEFILGKLAHPGNYYLWLNPDKPVPGMQIT